jgi:hypothetical protein
MRARRHQQRIPVRYRLRDGFGPDVAARAGTIFDDDGDLQPVAQLLAYHPRQHIDTRSRRVRNDDANGAVGVGRLGP